MRLYSLLCLQFLCLFSSEYKIDFKKAFETELLTRSRISQILTSYRINKRELNEIRENINLLSVDNKPLFFEITSLVVLQRVIDLKELDINLLDDLGQNFLHKLSINCDKKACRLVKLILEKTNINFLHQDYEGFTPLMRLLSTNCDRAKLIMLLKKETSDQSTSAAYQRIRNNQGQTALDIAKNSGQEEFFYKCLDTACNN